MPNLGLIAEAIATRYAPAQLPATPTGAQAIRSSSANVPNQLPARPCILVYPQRGTFDQGNSTRLGGADWLVRLYYQETGAGDLERDSDQIRDWLTLLVAQLQVGATLGGLVTIARVTGWNVGQVSFAGVDYNAGDVLVHTVTSEPFPVTA